MKSLHSSLLLFLIFIFFIIDFSNEALSKNRKNVMNNKRDSNVKIRERKNKINNKTRKLDVKEDIEIYFGNSTFSPLKIYIDLAEFNETFPKESSNLDIEDFVKAMNRAKAILEDFLEIGLDNTSYFNISDPVKNIDSATYIKNNYNINNWTSLFDNGQIKFDKFNFYIFAKFTDELHEESASIILDDFHYTPVVGIVLFNENMKDINPVKLTEDYLTSYMLHHFIRLLGFNAALSEVRFLKILPYDSSKDIYYLIPDIFPKVINYTRKYFNCPSINKIELYIDKVLDEDDSYYTYNNFFDIIGLYWPKRYFLGELLTKFDYPEEQILSGLTLAFLDDLPYLRVTKNYTGGPMKFGKNKGCEFFDNHCGSSDNPSYTFANEFYLPPSITDESEPSCSSGRLSKTVYKLIDFEEMDEEEEITIEYYLGEKEKAGPKSTNYCPIAQLENNNDNTPIYEGHCFYSEQDQDLDRYEKFGNDSFCVLSSLSSSTSSGEQVKALCYQMSCSPRSLTIKIGVNYIVCPREGGKIEAENFNGFLLCPDYNLICSGTSLCNNLFDCLTTEYKEKEESFNYDYDEIKTTQNSNKYNKSDYERSYGWELTDEGVCPYECMQCKSKTECIRCRPHYIYDSETNKCKEENPFCLYENEENDICKSCNDSNHFLVETSDGKRYCENEAIKSQYYIYDTIEGVDLYKKCDIENCITCVKDTNFANQVKCQSCSDPFKIIDGGEICGDLSTQLFYEDSSGIYKTCKNYPSYDKCYKCQKSGDAFECLECTSIGDYILSYLHSPPSCVLRSSVDDTMYTTDNKKYYPCNNELYNDIPNCEKCDNKEQCKQCSSLYTINATTSCILTSDINDHKYYKNPQNNFYYKCPNECTTCESETKCFGCNSPYLLTEDYTCIDPSLFTQKLYYYNNSIEKYSKCTNIPNCYKCESGTECISCQGDYKLVLGDDSQITCQIINTAQYYEINTGAKTYYSKCSIINKCDECSSNNYCTKCLNNYDIVDNDHTKCEDISGEKYYYDTELETYKLCSNKMTNCEKCLVNEDFICKNCFNTYSFKHDNNIECEVKTSLQNDPKFFTNDTGINYYSCAKFSEVENCDECSSEEICHKCKSGFDLYNNGTLCVQKSDIDNNIYIWTPNGLLSPCSSLIKDCHKCNETSKCYECQEDSALIDNDTCLKKTELEEKKNYFKDETTNRYISCSIMDNCNTCESRTECTSCLDGFILSNNLCNKINNDNNDDDGLGTGAIIGIVFGVVGFLLLAILTGYYLIKKVFNKNNGKQVNTNANNAVNDDAINIDGNERVEIVKDEKTVDTEKVDVQNKKRSIHNA